MQHQKVADSSLCRQLIMLLELCLDLLIFAVMMVSEREGTRWFVSIITTIIAAYAIETPDGHAFPFFATYQKARSGPPGGGGPFAF